MQHRVRAVVGERPEQRTVQDAPSRGTLDRMKWIARVSPGSAPSTRTVRLRIHEGELDTRETDRPARGPSLRTRLRPQLEDFAGRTLRTVGTPRRSTRTPRGPDGTRALHRASIRSRGCRCWVSAPSAGAVPPFDCRADDASAASRNATAAGESDPRPRSARPRPHRPAGPQPTDLCHQRNPSVSAASHRRLAEDRLRSPQCGHATTTFLDDTQRSEVRALGHLARALGDLQRRVCGVVTTSIEAPGMTRRARSIRAGARGRSQSRNSRSPHQTSPRNC